MLTIVDSLTGNVIERELNDDEKKQQILDAAENAKIQAQREANAKAQAAAKAALLERLGITEEEAKLLLG